jgi:TetR/AcrR family tetracycline transcriptional repressor
MPMPTIDQTSQPTGDSSGASGAIGPCRSTQSARAPLSRDRIIDAAMCYVDANCLDDLSMRRLGSELGVEAMSLYRYFPSKAQLLDGVVCHALGSLELPPSAAAADWEAHVRAFARSFRRIAREHPRLVPLLATMGPGNHTLSDVGDRMVQLWRSAGLDDRSALRAQNSLQSYITGSSLWNPSPERSDEDFEFGLDALIAGLRQIVDERGAATAASAAVAATMKTATSAPAGGPSRG